MLQEECVNMYRTPLTSICVNTKTSAILILYPAQPYQIGGQKEENLPGTHRLDQLMRPSQTQYCLGSTNKYKA